MREGSPRGASDGSAARARPVPSAAARGRSRPRNSRGPGCARGSRRRRRRRSSHPETGCVSVVLADRELARLAIARGRRSMAVTLRPAAARIAACWPVPPPISRRSPASHGAGCSRALISARRNPLIHSISAGVTRAFRSGPLRLVNPPNAGRRPRVPPQLVVLYHHCDYSHHNDCEPCSDKPNHSEGICISLSNKGLCPCDRSEDWVELAGTQRSNRKQCSQI